MPVLLNIGGTSPLRSRYREIALGILEINGAQVRDDLEAPRALRIERSTAGRPCTTEGPPAKES